MVYYKRSGKNANKQMGKISIDTFASHINKKTQRLNSKYICPGSEGVNAFSVNWSNESNLLVPPVYLITKTIKHFMSSKYSAKAVLVCPYWPSSTFWPLSFKAQGEFQSFIKDVFVIEDVPKYIKLQRIIGRLLPISGLIHSISTNKIVFFVF